MSLKGDTADPHADLAGHDDLSLDLGEPGQVTVSRKDGGLFGLLPGTPLMTLKGNFQDTPNGVEGRVFDDQGQTAGSFQNGVLHLTPEAESRLDVLAGRAGGKAPGAGASKTVDGKPLAAEALPAAAAAAVSQAKSEGCDLAFVEEPSSYAKDTPWRKYEDQTPGRLFDPVTGNPIVPALRYDNKSPNGAPYVRFDGFQPMAGGEIEVIDSKLSITNFQHGGKMVVPENITDQFERQSRALKQNPGCVGMINMPNAAEQTKAEAVIKGLGIVNLPVSIRPFIQ
jgi:hypothetical protein